jgi:uncharacterized damage-inducible protein DinB
MTTIADHDASAADTPMHSMTAHSERTVLDAVLESWSRSNAALIGLLRLLPDGALAARATPTSPSIAQLCAHLHHERMVSVAENAPEHAGPVPDAEWDSNHDVESLAAALSESCACVQAAVRGRIEAGQVFDRDFTHPVQLVQFLIFHDGYHHGQIKLALKTGGLSLPDDLVGEKVWDVWRGRMHGGGAG